MCKNLGRYCGRLLTILPNGTMGQSTYAIGEITWTFNVLVPLFVENTHRLFWRYPFDGKLPHYAKNPLRSTIVPCSSTSSFSLSFTTASPKPNSCKLPCTLRSNALVVAIFDFCFSAVHRTVDNERVSVSTWTGILGSFPCTFRLTSSSSPHSVSNLFELITEASWQLLRATPRYLTAFFKASICCIAEGVCSWGPAMLDASRCVLEGKALAIWATDASEG